MNTTALKIVLDTNILIAVIGRSSPYRWIFDCLINGALALCVSNEILFEYREILERKTSPEVAENVISFIIVNPSVIKTQIFYNFNWLQRMPKITNSLIAQSPQTLSAWFPMMRIFKFSKRLIFRRLKF